jgi:GDP/UDP-N,N'-diacetylbacillosamine 2-epimerase (hydrolysing)
MGESPERVFVTGAPGLDGITDGVRRDRAALCASLTLDPARPVALVVFHPVVQEAARAGDQAGALLNAVLAAGCQALCLSPNSDAGGQGVRAALLRRAAHPDVRLLDHLPRDAYLEWLSAAEVLAGNSSSGIIEAASFALPVVNVGSRQDGRERSGNVIDAAPEREAIETALRSALARGRVAVRNVYGDGRAGERIVELLATLAIDAALLAKTNAY